MEQEKLQEGTKLNCDSKVATYFRCFIQIVPTWWFLKGKFDIRTVYLVIYLYPKEGDLVWLESLLNPCFFVSNNAPFFFQFSLGSGEARAAGFWSTRRLGGIEDGSWHWPFGEFLSDLVAHMFTCKLATVCTSWNRHEMPAWLTQLMVDQWLTRVCGLWLCLFFFPDFLPNLRWSKLVHDFVANERQTKLLGSFLERFVLGEFFRLNVWNTPSCCTFSLQNFSRPSRGTDTKQGPGSWLKIRREILKGFTWTFRHVSFTLC